MINAEMLYNLFDCREGFELPDKIIDMFDNDINRFNEVVYELAKEVDIDSLDRDSFLDYFQTEHSDRKSLKQDYTPYEVSKLIYKLINREGSVLDMCAGTGSLSMPWVNDGQERNIEMLEYSKRTIAFLLLNLAIRESKALITQIDVLTKEYIRCLYIDKLSVNYEYDVVISNPPYSFKWEPMELVEGIKPPPKHKADYAFVLRGLERLRDSGIMAMILPHGVLFRGQAEGEIRKYLIDNNLIDAVIGLPDSMFQNTTIPVCIIIFKKNRTENNVLFIDASREFKKDGKLNKLADENIEKIVSVYKNRLEVNKYSHLATYEEIKENDFNLNIPRYVDTFEEVEHEPIDVTVSKLLDTQIEIVRTQDSFIKLMKELAGSSDKVQCELDRAVAMLDELQKVEVDKLESIIEGFSEDRQSEKR